MNDDESIAMNKLRGKKVAPPRLGYVTSFYHLSFFVPEDGI